MVHCMMRYCTSVMEAYSDLVCVCVCGSLYEEVLYCTVPLHAVNLNTQAIILTTSVPIRTVEQDL